MIILCKIFVKTTPANEFTQGYSTAVYSNIPCTHHVDRHDLPLTCRDLAYAIII
jgi:hypothetical protein